MGFLDDAKKGLGNALDKISDGNPTQPASRCRA